MANIVPECKNLSCFIDGNVLGGEIEVCDVPDLEIFRINPNARMDPLNVELQVWGDGREILAAIGKAAGKPMCLEIRALIKNNYGGTVPASWKFRGKPMNIPQPIPTTTLTFNAVFYEHIIDGEEKYYIDIFKYIRRVDGIDQLQSIREGL